MAGDHGHDSRHSKPGKSKTAASLGLGKASSLLQLTNKLWLLSVCCSSGIGEYSYHCNNGFVSI